MNGRETASAASRTRRDRAIEAGPVAAGKSALTFDVEDGPAAARLPFARMTGGGPDHVPHRNDDFVWF
jgi:hypothetical protein